MKSIVERKSMNPRTGPGRGWSFKVFLLLFAFASSVIPRLAAQPVNDNFTNAISITGTSGTIIGSTIGATVEPGEPFNLYGRSDHTVWYRWTATNSGLIVFDTVGSSFDTVLSAYAGSNLTALIQLDSDDDGAGFPWSLVAFPAIAGESYYLAVDGFLGASGFFRLNWNFAGNCVNGVVSPTEVSFVCTANYSVDENTPGFATVTVIAGGGFTNNVSVDYFTTDGTAVAGVDYLSVSNTLVFAPGDTARAFTIPILDNSFQNSNKTIFVTLANPTGEAVLGSVSNAVVTIVDDETPAFSSAAGEFNIVWPDSPIQSVPWPINVVTLVPPTNSVFSNFFFFSSLPNYLVTGRETFIAPAGRSTRGALITVKRSAPASGRVLVDFYTTNLFITNIASITNISGTNITNFVTLGQTNPIARPGIDYQPVSGTLLFDDYQMSANFIVPIINGGFTNPVYFNVMIANARPAPEEDPAIIVPTIGGTNFSTVEILKVDGPSFGVSVERATFRGDEYRSFSQGTTNVITPGNNTLFVSFFAPIGNGSAIVSVNIAGRYVFPLQPGSDYTDPTRILFDNTPYTDGTATLTNSADYDPAPFTISFGANRRDTIAIPITDEDITEFNEDIEIFIESIVPGSSLTFGPNRFGTATICYDDQPAGAADREWNPEGVVYTNPRFYTTPGANNTVNAVAVQPDNKTLLGGDFDHVNSFTRNHVARFNIDGSLDQSFAPGTAADGGVNALVLYPPTGTNANKVLIGGAFSSYNGTARRGLARLNTNGTLDTTFSPGNGADGVVQAVALQNDGKIIVAGDFTFFNDLNVHGIMRVNPDGTLDNTFNPGFGADDVIWSVVIDEISTSNRTIYVAGEFTTFDGQPRNRLVRLTDNGAVDPAFEPGLGADNAIYAAALQNDGKLLIGGAFSMYHTLQRGSLARINPDGTLDQDYNVGSGANDAIFAIKLQPDGKALIGGVFTAYNGTRRMGLARIFTGGSLDTSFMDTAYNQFAGLPKTFSFDNPSFVNTIALQANGDLMIGGSFTNVGGNLSVNYPFAATDFDPISGRTFGKLSGAHPSAPFTRQDKTTRYNIARIIGGYTPGPGNLEYDPASEPFSIDEGSGNLYVTLRRVDGRLGTAQVVPSTTNNTALFPLDFSSSTSTQTWFEYDATRNAVFVSSPISVGFVGNEYFAVPITQD